MLAEFAGLIDELPATILLPLPSTGIAPASDEHTVDGLILGPATVLVAVPFRSGSSVSVCVVDASLLQSSRLDTFDPSVHWTRITGPLDGTGVDASPAWGRALATAHRSLAAELVSVADTALHTAIEHVSSRVQFGTAIGALQAPRHALADAAAQLEAARAMLSESWRTAAPLQAQLAKASAGRAHRWVADAALQVCGAIGLTAEHRLHRYAAGESSSTRYAVRTEPWKRISPTSSSARRLRVRLYPRS
ncbi:acyl-CoA dehydrogenase family protein [Mycobacterium genavense]|uniref:acyl-CoA dehydrogenase family protein n=1 Tax=Mycobacterium genavense TaxID=36812 RepID=UPI0004AD4C38